MNRLALFLTLLATPAFAGPPVVVDAKASRSGGSWSVNVTISHGDTGWDHYADGWSVLAPDGTVLGYRKLLHPHVNEQPFTRSLSGIEIPPGTPHVLILPHDSVHGDGETYQINLRPAG